MIAEECEGASILVVDDTIENLHLLTSMLEKHGYEARPVASGRQALQAVERAPPDVILLDIRMPGMDGYEVCRRLKAREELRDIPVIFLSALADTADKVRAFEAGGVDYVTKPFQVEEVLARVRTHLALRRARLELAQSYERLRALEELRDNLVHMVAHDIRSPLTVLMGTLDLLAMGPAGRLGDEVTADLRAAQESVKEIHRMVDNLLDVRRLEDGKMPVERTRCDLAEIAARVREDLSRWQPQREIDLEAAGPVEIVCDGKLIERVLENLVGNGIKHTPPEGRLRIVIEKGEDRVRGAVHDEGPGIPPEARETIFEMFGTLQARADRTYHSVGLGLAFCKLAVEAHGGTLGVDSGEARGSTFWFELPV
jgi:K+-sensing histidine kinase KdpD